MCSRRRAISSARPDVASMEDRPLDGAGRLLGDGLGLAQARPDAHEADGPRAGEIETVGPLIDRREVVLQPVGLPGNPRQADPGAPDRGIRVALGHHVLADRGQPRELDAHAIERAPDDGLADVDEIGPQQGQDIQGFGVAEAGVVLQQANAVPRGHEAAVEDAAIPLAGVAQQRLRHRGVDGAGRADVLVGQEGEAMILARVRPHAARVGPAIPLVRPLVILDDHHVDHVDAVAERLEGELLAVELLLDHHRRVLPRAPPARRPAPRRSIRRWVPETLTPLPLVRPSGFTANSPSCRRYGADALEVP